MDGPQRSGPSSCAGATLTLQIAAFGGGVGGAAASRLADIGRPNTGATRHPVRHRARSGAGASPGDWQFIPEHTSCGDMGGARGASPPVVAWMSSGHAAALSLTDARTSVMAIKQAVRRRSIALECPPCTPARQGRSDGERVARKPCMDSSSRLISRWITLPNRLAWCSWPSGPSSPRRSRRRAGTDARGSGRRRWPSLRGSGRSRLVR